MFNADPLVSLLVSYNVLHNYHESVEDVRYKDACSGLANLRGESSETLNFCTLV